MPKHYTEVDSQSTLTNLKDAGFLSSSVGLVRSVSPGSNPVRYGSPSKVVFFIGVVILLHVHSQRNSRMAYSTLRVLMQHYSRGDSVALGTD